MVEIYLRLLDLVLTPVLLLLSVILTLRGHDQPGGGFIGGLVATSAFALQIVARGAPAVQRTVGRWLFTVTGCGLLLAGFSALLGALLGQAFFQALWITIDIGAIHYKIGTPVTFDLGVFFAVLGVSVSFLLGLSQGIIGPPAEPPPPPAATPAAAAATPREEAL